MAASETSVSGNLGGWYNQYQSSAALFPWAVLERGQLQGSSVTAAGFQGLQFPYNRVSSDTYMFLRILILVFLPDSVTEEMN